MNPLDDPKAATKFWGAAGIGYFLFSDLICFGGGFINTGAGLIAGLVTVVDKLVRGNLGELAAGKDTKFAPELVRWW
ncbi:MAG: hypothetical protein ACTSX7_20210 [Alphaproteobacteria bacterium]